MWNWLKRFFPENIFARKIDPSAERRLRLAQARAEESIIRAHVDNALMFVDTWLLKRLTTEYFASHAKR